MKLSWKQTRSYTGWVKYVGKNTDGKPRCFYLGGDRSNAETTAMRLTLAWKQLRASGLPGWTEQAVRTAISEQSTAPQTLPVTIPASPANPADPVMLPVFQPSLMLHKAMDEYFDYERGRTPDQVTYAYLHGVRVRVRRLKVAMPDRPLAEVGYDDLAALVAHFAARPLSKTTGERLSVVTAADMIKGARAMFDWLDVSERWVAPRRFERIFRVRRKNLMTAEERDREREGVETFTVEELRKIMEMAWTRWHRVVIVTALNLAMTQGELSSLRRRHIKGLDTDSPYIEKCREKTEIFCRWGYIFPEVADGLRWALSGHDRQFVFVNPNGKPPVTFYEGGRTDTVAAWWSRLVKRAGVRPLTFRYLRKTAADMVRKLSDKDTSEAMLAHSNEGVVKRYTNHDWQKLSIALQRLRDQLQPVFEVDFDRRPTIPRQRRKRAT